MRSFRSRWRLFVIALGSLVDLNGQATRRALDRELGRKRFATVEDALRHDKQQIAGDFARAAEKLAATGEATPEQGRALFDRVARRHCGISGEEFLRRWDAGEITYDTSMGVTTVAMLIPFARSAPSV